MKRKRIWTAIFLAYCALMLWLLFDRAGYEPGIPYTQQLKFNLIPLETIGRFLKVLIRGGSRADQNHAIINLVGNVIMFIPLGFCLPMLWKKQRTLWKTLLTTALIITLVELTQLLTLVGSCDTDDLILNVLGSAIGYGLFKMFQK